MSIMDLSLWRYGMHRGSVEFNGINYLWRGFDEVENGNVKLNVPNNNVVIIIPRVILSSGATVHFSDGKNDILLCTY